MLAPVAGRVVELAFAEIDPEAAGRSSFRMVRRTDLRCAMHIGKSRNSGVRCYASPEMTSFRSSAPRREFFRKITVRPQLIESVAANRWQICAAETNKHRRRMQPDDEDIVHGEDAVGRGPQRIEQAPAGFGRTQGKTPIHERHGGTVGRKGEAVTHSP